MRVFIRTQLQFLQTVICEVRGVASVRVKIYGPILLSIQLIFDTSSIQWVSGKVNEYEFEITS